MRSRLVKVPKRGAIVDLKHGYLFAPGDGAQTDVYLTLFKKRSGGYLIVVRYYASDTQDFNYLEAYVYRDGSWTEVTKSVLGVKISEELKYELPRYGRAIRVRTRKGKRLYDLVWSGEKFRLRK